MSVESEIPYLGEIIAGRYELEFLLGQGGMGLVYGAHDRKDDRQVAVKILWPGALHAYSDASARFQRECRIASALRHPGAVTIHDFGSSAHRLYLVMELLQGEPLSRRLQRTGKLPPEQVARIGYDVADVLAAAHALPAIHRDLKPANVFLARTTGEVDSDDAARPGDRDGDGARASAGDGARVSAGDGARVSAGAGDGTGAADGSERTVVLDFGLAFVMDAEDTSVGRLTSDSKKLGTPSYMSPEQVCDVGLGPPADIYSLGCVLYELLTGQPPFQGSGPAEVLAQHIEAPVPSARAQRPETTPELDALVTHMMAKRALDRPTARVVLDRLAAIAPATLEGRLRARRIAEETTRPATLGMLSRRRRDAHDPASLHVRVAILGAHSDFLVIALGAYGVAATSYATLADIDASADRIDAVLVRSGDAGTVAALAARMPVLVEVEASDQEAAAALQRAGAAELVSPSGKTDDLARRIKQLVRRSKAPRA